MGRVKNKSAFLGTEYKQGKKVLPGPLTSSSNFKGENKDQYIRIYSSDLSVDASEVEPIGKLDAYAKNNREKIDSLVDKRRSGGAEIGESKSNSTAMWHSPIISAKKPPPPGSIDCILARTDLSGFSLVTSQADSSGSRYFAFFF